MEKFIRGNWFRLIIAVAVIFVSVSLFYHFVIFTPQKEQTRLKQEAQVRLLREAEKQDKELELQEQATASAEMAYWNGKKRSVQDVLNSSSKVRLNFSKLISESREYINKLYLIESDPDHSVAAPLVQAYEQLITALQNCIDVMRKEEAIQYEMLSAIEGRNQAALDALGVREEAVHSIVVYWMGQIEKEQGEANAVRTQVIRGN